MMRSSQPSIRVSQRAAAVAEVRRPAAAGSSACRRDAARASAPREHDADGAALLVRVHRVVPPGQREAERGRARARGRAAPWPTTGRCARARRTAAAGSDGSQSPGMLDVAAERIRHEIDRVAERRQRADAMEFGERSAPGLEERLRRDHQDVHARRPGARGRVTSATWYTTPPTSDAPRPSLPMTDRLRRRPAARHAGRQALHLDRQDRRQRRLALRAAVAASTSRGSGSTVRTASVAWLALRARRSISAMILVSAWRWSLLLRAQHVAGRRSARSPIRSSSRRSSTTFCRRTSAATSSGSATRARRPGRRRWRRRSCWSIAASACSGSCSSRRSARRSPRAMSEAIGPIGPGLLWAALRRRRSRVGAVRRAHAARRRPAAAAAARAASGMGRASASSG